MDPMHTIPRAHGNLDCSSWTSNCIADNSIFNKSER